MQLLHVGSNVAARGGRGGGVKLSRHYPQACRRRKLATDTI